MVGWHHRLNGHEFEQTVRVGEGQGSWHATVPGVAKGRARLSDRTERTIDLQVQKRGWCVCVEDQGQTKAYIGDKELLVL